MVTRDISAERETLRARERETQNAIHALVARGETAQTSAEIREGYATLREIRTGLDMLARHSYMEMLRANTNPAEIRTAMSGYARDVRTFRYRPMLASEARALDSAEYYSPAEHYALAWNGVIRRVRRNGAVKTWKRDTNRVEVPLKYGMYEAFRDSARWDGTMQHLIVLIDAAGNPTFDETAAEVS